MNREIERQALGVEAGSRVINGPQMIYKPNPKLLVRATGLASGSWSGQLRMPVPDSRCRVKLSVIFYPRQGQGIPTQLKEIGTIWVAGYEEDSQGFSGNSGSTQPVQDVEGDSATPTLFPVSTGLAGYSREFVTAADWVEAAVTINANAAVIGTWTMQTRIQPDAGAFFTWEEWDQLRRSFQPSAFGSGAV